MNLKQIIDNKLKEIYQDSVPKEVKSRIEEEFHIISEHKIEYQYLIAYKISEKSKADNRIMIDRVCGSSYIAYLLGITFVNPIEYYIYYEDGFEPITFDLEFASDYLPTIFEYTKEICKQENIVINELEDLKKHNIYLNTFRTAYLLEKLEDKTNKKREDIDLNDITLYKDLMNKKTSLLEDFEMEVLENLQSKNMAPLKCILHLSLVFSLSHSTISDKLDIIDHISFNPRFREDIYSILKTSGIEKSLAVEIMNFIAKGKHHYHKEQWEHYISVMKDHGIGNEYIDYCSKIDYLYPKSYSVNRAILYVWLTYYKIHYSKIYNDLKFIV